MLDRFRLFSTAVAARWSAADGHSWRYGRQYKRAHYLQLQRVPAAHVSNERPEWIQIGSVNAGAYLHTTSSVMVVILDLAGAAFSHMLCTAIVE